MITASGYQPARVDNHCLGNTGYRSIVSEISTLRLTSNQCIIGQQIIVSKNLFLNYFILSNEIMENISAIKVVSMYSEMIWYHFTVD